VQVQAQLEELKSDFKYNLQLLAERDAELERYEANATQLEAEAAAKAATALQLRAALAQAQSGGWTGRRGGRKALAFGGCLWEPASCCVRRVAALVASLLQGPSP
jgi:predicted aminopeptidase